MRACILGFGSIGVRHAKNLTSLGHEVSFLRSGKSSLNQNAKQRVWPEFFQEEDCLRWRPDFLVVATPTSLHYSGALFGLKNGLHVYVEKPMATSSENLLHLIHEAASRGVLLRMGYQLRHHRLVVMAKQIASEKINRQQLKGFSVSWLTNFRTWHPWEDYANSYVARQDLGGGALNTMSHEIDLISFLFGRVQSIDAVLTYSDFDGLEMGLDAAVRTTNGVSGVVQLRLDQLARERKTKLLLNSEVVEMDLEGDTLVSSSSDKLNFRGEGLHDAAYLAAISDFVDAIETGGFSEEDARDMFETERLISCFRQAGKSLKKVFPAERTEW